MITVAVFRASLPAFASVIVYPDAAVDFWMMMASTFLPPVRWGASSIPVPPPAPPVAPTVALTKYDFGVMMFTAHNLVLEKQSADAVSRGGTPGQRTGAISADSVGPISRSYDTSKTLDMEADHWNLTTYGLRFRALSKMVGSGPIQAGGGCGFGFPWFWDGNPSAAFYQGPNWPPWGGPPMGFGPGWNGG